MDYGTIAYEDQSLLNAQWAQARPAVAGLGFFPSSVDADLVRRYHPPRNISGLGEPRGYGQHSYVDVSFLNARLRPILPATVGLSPDGLGGGSLGGNSLGASTGEFSKEQILLAQDLMNGALIQNGMAPIDDDGKLGPATCGAIKWYQQNVDPNGGASFNTACSTVTPVPPHVAGGGGTEPVRKGAPASTRVPVQTAGMFGGGANWMLIGGAVAAIAVGGALIFRASKKR